MIALATDCLLFKMSNGESRPMSADTISAQMFGDIGCRFDNEFVQHVANAVFHYFKFELARREVTCDEFKRALEKVLKGFGQKAPIEHPWQSRPGVIDADLLKLVGESEPACELLLFPRLRDEFRKASQMLHPPRTLRFRQLRGCVKRVAGARRWSARCELLKEQILEYLRGCLRAEIRGVNMSMALVVEG